MSLNMRGINQLITRLEPALDQAAMLTTDKGVEIVRSEVPVLSGDLQGTTRPEQLAPGRWRVVSGKGAINYGPHVNYGTPRQHANPYMDRSAERMKKEAKQIAAAIIRELVRSASQ